MIAATPPSVTGSADGRRQTGMAAMVVSLFFVWGFVTVLNDPLIAKLKGLFSLNYAEAMLTQFAFFLGYFIFSIPAGMVLSRLGYVRTIVLGLTIMAAGCLMFVPAAMAGTYIGFLCALFVVAAGITTLQVAANPYIAVLGPRATSSSRLTLAQAFNSLGTFLAPFVGAMFLLQRGVTAPSGATADALRVARLSEASLVLKPFLFIACAMIVMAMVFWLVRRAPAPAAGGAEGGIRLHLLRRPRLMFGVLSIFLYVGAEVAVGSGMTNYLMQESVLGHEAAQIGESASSLLAHMFHHSTRFNAAQVAGAMVAIYWGFAMVGRFVGSALLVRLAPAKVLCFHALAAMALALLSASTVGVTAAVAVLLIGMANSIMFPTIFTLALDGLETETAGGSSLLCMAIVGGAIVPVAYGLVADIAGLAFALVLPAGCYLIIAGYGLFVWRGSRCSHGTGV
jgi:FHS family L-fucose permease-like MFS transporter